MGHGSGGHFHSLNHISQEIGKNIPVSIVTIGPGFSPVLKKNRHFSQSIYFNGWSLFNLRSDIHQILKKNEPTIIHFFDINVYNIIKPLLPKKKYGLVVNKCGGPNPIEFPRVENLILFSGENKNWFKNQQKYIKTSIFLIPNRARQIELKSNKLINKPQDRFCFLRIARIGEAYIKSINDSIDLILSLRNDHNLEVCIYIIGTIQNENIYKILKERIKPHQGYIHLLTDEEYTQEASNMLYLADAVIATGRGIMEAASLKLPILTPAKNSSFPILINSENYVSFFTTNFSERNEASEYDVQNNMKEIIEAINNKTSYKNHSNFAYSIFEKFFNIKKVFEKYLEVYNQVDKKRISKFADFKLKLKSYYSFYINSK